MILILNYIVYIFRLLCTKKYMLFFNCQMDGFQLLDNSCLSVDKRAYMFVNWRTYLIRNEVENGWINGALLNKPEQF